ncbi:MAG: DUF983 domain-containing protein [Saprospiraceae bacterium]
MARIFEKLRAVFGAKCPRCEKGKMFSSGLFEFSKFLNMPEKCEHCGLHFTPEPGFYMGSMFISYGVFTWGMLGLIAVFYLVFNIGINLSIFLAVICGLISFTYVIRLARTVALHMVCGYDPKRV